MVSPAPSRSSRTAVVDEFEEEGHTILCTWQNVAESLDEIYYNYFAAEAGWSDTLFSLRGASRYMLPILRTCSLG